MITPLPRFRLAHAFQLRAHHQPLRVPPTIAAGIRPSHEWADWGECEVAGLGEGVFGWCGLHAFIDIEIIAKPGGKRALARLLGEFLQVVADSIFSGMSVVPFLPVFTMLVLP